MQADGLVRHKTSNLSVVGVPQASYASDAIVAEEEGHRSYQTNPNHVKLIRRVIHYQNMIHRACEKIIEIGEPSLDLASKV